MTERPDIPALVGSRICHDLISPLGAIGNGVELLQLAGGPISPELALIAESVASANARIRFYRISYGAASADQRIGRPEVTGVLADISRGSRHTFDWQVASDVSRNDAKLAFLLIQCLESALPFGGRIVIQSSVNRWRLTGSAPRMKVDDDLWSLLQNGVLPERLRPEQVHFALAADEAARRGLSLRHEIGAEAITLSF
ncbi:MAG: histidine phosphotransferase [Paracoccaceae bacterium]|nr:histidine phosphotransferase [Paracoccaceae bacterium]MDE3240341.1 histidine phosphotransferase [Paracoccaceae bacterium]